MAARHALPTIYNARDYIAARGLMSYGTPSCRCPSPDGQLCRTDTQGEKPADLPVQQSVKVELVINLKTAKALGLTIPQTLLVVADEVIE